MTLDLPGRVPLPDDVRHRVLDSVLAGLDEPPARRRPFLAAAVAAVLVVGVSVAATLAVTNRPGPELALPAAPPTAVAPAPAPVVEPLDRCRAAAPEGAGYPPAAEWRMTWEYDLGVDKVVVVDDRFACLVGAQAVTVGPLEGAPVGGASLVRLAPAVVAVLNPDGLPVSVSGDASARDWNDPRVIVIATDGWFGEDYRIVVGDTYDGPPPPDLPTGERVVDRPLPTRVYDESDDQVMNLEACLTRPEPSENSEPDLWIPAFTVATPEPPVLVARIGDRFAGYCVLEPDGPPLFNAGELRPGWEAGQILASSSTTVPSEGLWDGVPVRLLAVVPAGTRRVEMSATDGDGTRTNTECALDGDLALCQLAAHSGYDPVVSAFNDTPDPVRIVVG